MEYSTSQADRLCQYYCDNKAHLEPWEPLRDRDFYTEPYWQERLQIYESQAFDFATRTGSLLSYLAIHLQQNRVVGSVNLSNITLGVFKSCFMGYSIDHDYLNQGYASEIASAATEFAFSTVGLHRVAANYMPENQASGKVLEKVGFKREGLAPDYLKINGQWRDHILTARLNPEHTDES